MQNGVRQTNDQLRDALRARREQQLLEASADESESLESFAIIIAGRAGRPPTHRRYGRRSLTRYASVHSQLRASDERAQATLAAVWIAMTHVLDAFDYVAYIPLMPRCRNAASRACLKCSNARCPSMAHGPRQCRRPHAQGRQGAAHSAA